MSLAPKLPKLVEIEVFNKNINESRSMSVEIQYDMFPKYCHTCNLQCHEEMECRSVNPELKEKKLTKNFAEESYNANAISKTPIQRRFINGRVVLSKWTTTNRWFNDHNGKVIEEPQLSHFWVPILCVARWGILNRGEGIGSILQNIMLPKNYSQVRTQGKGMSDTLMRNVTHLRSPKNNSVTTNSPAMNDELNKDDKNSISTTVLLDNISQEEP